MNATKNIIIKELTRVFTDKKLIISLFVLPGVLIMVMYSLMGKLMTNMESDITKHVPIVYIQNAPKDLSKTIEMAEFEGKIQYLSSKDDTNSIKDGILKGDVELLVVFDEEFTDLIHNYEQTGDLIPEVKTYYNTAEDYSYTARDNFVNRVLYSYQQSLLSARLNNMEQLQVFYIDKQPESSILVDEEKASGKSLSMLLPFLINIMLFQGAMGLGIDAITGEKERGTLSSMLLSPIKRSNIVFGKLLSLAILTSISAIIYTFSVIIGIKNLQGNSMGEIGSINFTLVEMFQLLSILILVVFLYVAMVALVAVYARTAKEAGTYVMPLMILVMLASIMTMFSSGVEKGIEYYAIPVYNSAICIQNLFMGELTMAQYGITIGTLAILAAIITTMITRAFNSEKVMFNA
ncbi:MAG TPA: ABC transporter permease [Mobilitalea sp.]|nr:ABC transporter permease [Mobilitalea sp.]